MEAGCFPAGTLVSTESGQRPIETIQPGERVWAFDVKDGQWKLRHVLRTFSHLHDGQFVSMKVAGETIESTPGHPFWVVQGDDLELRPRPEHVPIPPWQAQLPGRWVDAGDLRVGDVLYLKSGALAPIEELTLRPVREMVYNFQVEELESYAVGTGAVLVHNNSANTGGLLQAQDPRLKPWYDPGQIHLDHPVAEVFGGTATRPIPAAMNLRKGGLEGELRRYEAYLIRNGMTPVAARRVIASEIRSLSRDVIAAPFGKVCKKGLKLE